MTRKWTRKERREHIREKYYGYREKIFVVTACLFVLFVVLGLGIGGLLNNFSLQMTSLGMIIIVIIVFFLSVYGGNRLRIPITALLIILIIIAVYTGAIIIGMLSGIAFIVGVIVLALIFIVLVAVLAFIIDLVAYECL